jgi:O-antigen/teichoic acid export membrane protein
MEPVSDVASSSPTSRETVIVALGQGSIMVFGGVLALLIAQVFGKSTETDAFFAAYGVYAVGLTFIQSFRLTAVPRLVAGGDEAIVRMLGAVAIMTLALAVPMVLLATPLGGIVVENDPTGVAPDALRVLWIALVGQLVAAMLATVLVVRGSYTPVGVATLIVGFVSVGTFFATEGGLGILAAPVGLAVAGAWLAAVLGAMLMRTGWRPRAPRRADVREMWAEARHLTYASAFFFSASLVYVICVTFAARQGAGEATLFAYAYVLGAMLIGVTANVAAMVRSPGLVASSERTAEMAAAGLQAFRFTLVLTGPVLAMTLLVGKPVIGFALGGSYEGDSAEALLATLACLIGWIFAYAGGLFAVVELLARGERGRLAALAAGQVAAIAAAAAIGAELAGIQGIAAGLSLVTLAATAVLLRWAFGGGRQLLGARMARAAARELAVVALAFAPAALLVVLADGSTLATLAAALLAAPLVAAATYAAWPSESRALLRVLPARGPAA